MIFDCIRRFHFSNDNLEDGYSVTFLVFEHNKISTHYHNSNLIWRTVSRRVDEVIPSDHPRRLVIQWYGLIHET